MASARGWAWRVRLWWRGWFEGCEARNGAQAASSRTSGAYLLVVLPIQILDNHFGPVIILGPRIFASPKEGTMPATATRKAAEKYSEKAGDDSGDPDSTKNWLHNIIVTAIRESARRLKPSSFGVTERTLRDWAKRTEDWVPPPSTLSRIACSGGFSRLSPGSQRAIRQAWLVTTLEATSRGRPPSDEFI